MRILHSKVGKGTLHEFVYKQLVFLITHLLIRLWLSLSLHTVAYKNKPPGTVPGSV